MSAASSQYDKAAIEAIVREVLRRLTYDSVSLKSAASPIADPETYACEEKIISLETLRGKLDQIKTLRLKPKTIVTPAVRDELRDRKIEILYDLASPAINATGKTILLGATCESTGTTLRDQIVAAGTEVHLEVDDRISRLSKKIGDKVSTTMRAMIVTDQPYTAVCVANRNANVRAVIIHDENEMLAAKSEINPNCIVLNQGEIEQLDLPKILYQINQ